MARKFPPTREVRRGHTGPYPVELDWREIKEMARAGCSGLEIASRLGVSPDTLYCRCEQTQHMKWSQFRYRSRCSGDSSLKEAQFELALSGDRQMLIWLGKQRLNQSEAADLNSGIKAAFDKFNALMEGDKPSEEEMMSRETWDDSEIDNGV